MSRLDITGGELRGRRLRTGDGFRPTTGRVREALFNILGTRVQGARVLDLFAGSGALGIEALSRGAATLTLVERHPARANLLAANLAELGLSDRARVSRAGVPGWLASQAEALEYDLVLLDPEYADETGLRRTLALMDTPGRLGPGTMVVVEHRATLDLAGVTSNLALVRTARYGDTALSFLMVQAES
ncbi:MAG: 16S rRNA (guanine(966)-N(2))-methyltransferase RsmD [Candidatus Dormibacteria bacterium]